ncbi:MAG: MogA/MoaB family molybdenum cofactor biosynthesis protein [Candidatus Altiarchaeota archaeon]|nr:MogA/MoaB family molybdenum cofactor biosynthesis protein [Candidatus Altiarchaeota archaeon]
MAENHIEEAEKIGVKVCVIVTSDTFTAETDTTGKLLVSVIEKSGFEVLDKEVVANDRALIEAMVGQKTQIADVIIITGGTGISKKDYSVDTLKPMFEKDIPGFGEKLRLAGFEQIGERALLSRACAGTINHTLIFCIPGTLNAAETALKIIVPLLKHAVYELKHK